MMRMILGITTGAVIFGYGLVTAALMASQAATSEVVRLLGPDGEHLGAWTAMVDATIDGPFVWAPGPIAGIEVTVDGQPTVLLLTHGPDDPWTLTAGDTLTVELAWRVVLARHGRRDQALAGSRPVAVCEVVGEVIGDGLTIPVCRQE